MSWLFSQALSDAPKRLFRPQARPAFTLVEMLVVVAIIGVLAALILSTLSAIQSNSKVRRVEFMFQSLRSDIERYRDGFNDFPDSQGEDGERGNEALYEALSTEEKDGPYIDDAHGYLFGDKNGNGAREFLDVWGNPLHYIHNRYFGRENPNRRSYRLISAGPDKEFDPYNPKSDDIRNWDKDNPD